MSHVSLTQQVPHLTRVGLPIAAYTVLGTYGHWNLDGDSDPHASCQQRTLPQDVEWRARGEIIFLSYVAPA